MLLKRRPDIQSSEITDEAAYLRRREFIKLAGGAALAAAAGSLSAACGSNVDAALGVETTESGGQLALANIKPRVIATDEPQNTYEQITGYNNFYEFGTGKADPARYAGGLRTSPWTVKIDGHCAKPADYQ